MGVYLITALALIGPAGMAGLALANSAQWIAHLAIMAVLTHQAIGGLQGLGLGSTIRAVVLASLVMVVALWAFAALVPPGIAESTIGLFAYVAAGIVLAAAVYLAVIYKLAPAELDQLLVAVRRRGKA